jgi:DNA polymerase I-like protein with 3'-5' exonuclease and polymerase domains
MHKFGKYNYINTLDKIREVDQYLCDSKGNQRFQYISVDTETNGLRLYKTTIVGFSFSVDSEKGFYVPLLEWVPDTSFIKKRTKKGEKYETFPNGCLKCVWTGKEYNEFVKPKDYEMPEFIPAIISKWFKGAKLIMHNAPFDVNHIYINTGIDLKDSVFLDTALLSHILNENTSNGLKETAAEWSAELGISPHQDAAQERKELGTSVFMNGGDVTDTFKPKSVWRAKPEYMNKYACADTFLTHGVFEVGIKKFITRFGEDKLAWLFEEEVMPVCRDVVIPMKRRGVYLDIPHFTKMEKELREHIELQEDLFIEAIKKYMPHFNVGESVDEAISHQALVKKIIELEDRQIPTRLDKKTGELKKSISKGVIKKVYQEDPHWIWGYILGEDEIKYSDKKLNKIKLDLYKDKVGRRYRFSLGSDNHLRWLFCDMLGYSKKDLPQTDSATKDNPIPSMKAEVLNEYMLKDNPWVKHLLIYKKLKKLHSTYVLPALELSIDGWLYMDMKQNGTVSGRFACGGGFNLQTLPNIDREMETLKECDKCGSENVTIEGPIAAICDRTCNDCGHVEHNIIRASIIKQGFIAPPGYKIVNADYSSLEPRCFAFMSGDNKLKEVYWNNLDLYSKVFCDMFDTKNQYSADPKADNFLKKVNKNARTETKPIVLGIPYGSRAFQVAVMCNKYKEITNKKTGKKELIPDTDYGQWVIDKYLSTYSSLHNYMEQMELNCVTQGYVESLYGRRRHFQYAPKIYKFLLSKGLTHKDIIDCKPSHLKSKSVNSVSNLGREMIFTEEELKILIENLGLDFNKCHEKGYWKYIRSLIKNELNNAKNWPIQACAGHITNKGMLDTTYHYQKNQIDGWVFLQVHDEISCYVKDDQTDLGNNLLKTGMEENIYATGIDVPMIADPIVAINLKDAK